MFNVYAIKNDVSGKIYIGQTSDLEKRLKRHNGVLKNKTKSFTSKNKGGWKLIYKEELNSRGEALIREKQLKSYRGREFIKSLLKK